MQDEEGLPDNEVSVDKDWEVVLLELERALAEIRRVRDKLMRRIQAAEAKKANSTSDRETKT